MNLFQLNYAIMAAECNSISKAAERLYTSQAACSNAISNLEKELQITIFERTNKGVRLTKQGEAFITQAKIIVNQTKILKEININYSEDIKTLKISSHRSFFLSSALTQMYEAYNNEDIRIYLNEVAREVVLNDVKDGNYGLGLIALNNMEDKFWRYFIDLNELEFNEIRKEKLYIYVGKTNPLYNNQVITYEELKELPGIFLPERFNFTKFYNIPINEMLIEGGRRSLYINDKDTMIKMVRNTTAFVVGMRISEDETPEGVKGIPLEKDEIYFTIGWIKRKNEPLTKEEEVFIGLL